MQIPFRTLAYEFKLWTPAQGQVFTGHYGFSVATTPQDPKRPWLSTPFVMGAGFDGRQGYFVMRHDLPAFLQYHQNIPVGLHDAAHQLDIMKTACQNFDLYQMVDRNLVFDSQLLHCLHLLATTGEVPKEESELHHAYCVKHYLGDDFPDATAADGRLVRTSYGQWLNREFHEIEPAYLEYLGKTAITTTMMMSELYQRLNNRLYQDSPYAYGFVSPQWLDQQNARWGIQTHHIQLRASIVLRTMSQNGLHLDVKRLDEVRGILLKRLENIKKDVLDAHYMPEGNKSGKSLQGVLKNLEKEYQVQFLRSPDDQYDTSHDALVEFAEQIPFIRDLLQYRETKALLDNLLNKIEKSVLHPSFNVLVKTGRTSSYGELNAQGITCDSDVRSCFVPSAGHVFLDCDYSTAELSTLAQACMSQFGIPSNMAKAINEGHDLHRFVAAQILKIPQDSVTPQDREKAKVFNFGIPGGMGSTTLLQKAKSMFGSEITEQEISNWSSEFLTLFPEIGHFRQRHVVKPENKIVELFELDPKEISRLFGVESVDAHKAIEIAGRTFMKIMREPAPKTQQGKPYSDELLEYCWGKVESKKKLLHPLAQQAVSKLQPSYFLYQQVKSIVDLAGVMTLTGRLRAQAYHTARCNTIFQGLAADGAKLALWQLWRSGYRVVNFIHDQFLIEIPRSDNYQVVIQNVEAILQNAMREVVPDVQVSVKSTIREHHWG